ERLRRSLHPTPPATARRFLRRRTVCGRWTERALMLPWLTRPFWLLETSRLHPQGVVDFIEIELLSFLPASVSLGATFLDPAEQVMEHGRGPITAHCRGCLRDRRQILPQERVRGFFNTGRLQAPYKGGVPQY